MVMPGTAGGAEAVAVAVIALPSAASNSYLALREAKMARNQARLQELGLVHLVQTVEASASAATRSTTTATATIARKRKHVANIITSAAVLPERRSLRIQRISLVNYADAPLAVHNAKESRKTGSLLSTINDNNDETTPVLFASASPSAVTSLHDSSPPSSTNTNHHHPPPPRNLEELLKAMGDDDSSWLPHNNDSEKTRNRNASKPSLPLKKNSARAMHLNVEKLLFGSSSSSSSSSLQLSSPANITSDDDADSDADRGLLGVPLQATGKAFVMQESARRAVGNNHDDSNNPISFNKYSGIQEWGNDVVFLWINLHDNDDHDTTDKKGVGNDFLKGGRHVTWYGGSRMHNGTNAIVKLKRIGTSNLNSEDATPRHHGTQQAAVVLWCRKYDKKQKGFGPYVCLGRLSLVSYDPESRPLAFVWNLLDYEKLVAHEDKHVREKFRNITGAII